MFVALPEHFCALLDTAPLKFYDKYFLNKTWKTSFLSSFSSRNGKREAVRPDDILPSLRGNEHHYFQVELQVALDHPVLYHTITPYSIYLRGKLLQVHPNLI